MNVSEFMTPLREISLSILIKRKAVSEAQEKENVEVSRRAVSTHVKVYSQFLKSSAEIMLP